LYVGTTFDIIHLVQSVISSENNIWDTDLTTTTKFFSVSSSGATYVNDYFTNPLFISPGTNTLTTSYYTLGKQAFDTFTYGGVTGNGATITYGTAIPTTGSYLAGSIVFNISPTAGSFVGWVCVTAGTPGTWKTFGAISL
jgi:hypothetical protein